VRYRAKKVCARDARHFSGRLLRKVLSHTVAVLLAVSAGLPSLHLANLLTDCQTRTAAG
jgi:hypothetical protein